MKNFTRALLMQCFLIAGCMGIFNAASAANFTAVLSGNFTSTTTWLGGIVPSLLSTADNITINNGVNVTLNQNLTISGSSSLTINGTLSSTAGNALILTGGSISGGGTINVDSIVMGQITGFTYIGMITAQKMTSLGANVSSTANTTVTGTLNLATGNYNMSSGSLTLGNNATIVVSGGTITVAGGGSFNLTNGYNVIYTNASATAGIELSGSGLTNMEVNVPSSSSVMLSSDLNIKGTLTLTSGSLVLNNRNLSFTGSGDFSASGTGTISATSASNISINSSNNFSGGLRFASGSNTVNNFTINMGSSTASVNLGTMLNVDGQLSLQAGNINVGSNSLMLGTSATVTGGSATSYVITGNGGSLSMNLGVGGSNTYHVGTTTKYAPAVISANTGSSTGTVSVGVNDSVWANGTSGASLSTQPTVNATWYVASSMTSNINLNMQLMWSANMEINSFNRANAYISHYTNSSWDAITSTSATTSGSMYAMSRNNITSLSPFTVMDKNATPNSVNTLSLNKDISIYPNPTTDFIYIKTTATPSKVAIYDVTGHLVKSSSVINNSVSVKELPAGFYNIHISGQDFYSVQKFVKE